LSKDLLQSFQRALYITDDVSETAAQETRQIIDRLPDHIFWALKLFGTKAIIDRTAMDLCPSYRKVSLRGHGDVTWASLGGGV